MQMTSQNGCEKWAQQPRGSPPSRTRSNVEQQLHGEVLAEMKIVDELAVRLPLVAGRGMLRLLWNPYIQRAVRVIPPVLSEHWTNSPRPG
jgi:hypothetical protein